MNMAEAVKATRNGAIAALVSAGLTLAVVLYAINADLDGRLAIYNDPWNMADVFIILVCALGMFRKSRVASVIILLYFISAKIIVALETQSFSGLGLSLVFVYFYARAIQGSFAYHRLKKEEDPAYRAAGKWTYSLAIPSVLLLTVLVGFSLISTTGLIPSTRVQAGNELSADAIHTLKEEGIVLQNEEIRYFYAHGLFSLLESGNVLTNQRVILYLTNEEGERDVYAIPLNVITEVLLEEEGDTFNNSVYLVNTDLPDEWLKLFLSVEQKGDKRFVEALQQSISEQTGRVKKNSV